MSVSASAIGLGRKRVISVISGKGGVGKSTLSVNVATMLAKRGASTVIIDADIYNPCVFYHLGLSPQSAGLQELLNGAASAESVLAIHPASGLRCISSSIQPYARTKAKNFRKVIDSLDYDYIIVDCPPGFSDLIGEAVAVSNDLFVVMTPDVPSCTAGLKLVSAFVKKTRHTDSPQLSTSYFLNRVSNAPYELHPAEVEALFKAKLSLKLPEDMNVPRSISAKTPVVLLSPSCQFSSSVKSYVSSINRHGVSGMLSFASHSSQSQPEIEETVVAEEKHKSGAGLSSLFSFISRLLGRK
ncbi:MAG: P-loop NTPase [Candidatus Anstonellaceae archaeon]